MILVTNDFSLITIFLCVRIYFNVQFMQFGGDKMPVTLCITEKVQVAFVNILVRKDRILQTINFKVILFFSHTGFCTFYSVKCYKTFCG